MKAEGHKVGNSSRWCALGIPRGPRESVVKRFGLRSVQGGRFSLVILLRMIGEAGVAEAGSDSQYPPMCYVLHERHLA
jgi:hypothetical protein